MGIPIAAHYSSTVSGAVLKIVRCEQCRTEYAYEMKRTAEGDGVSMLFLDNAGAADRAEERAVAALERRLERGVDAVPCPKCGWFQAHMVPKARKEFRRWMLTTGLVCFVLGILAGAPLAVVSSEYIVPPPPEWIAPVFAGVAGTLMATGLGLMLLKVVTSRGYDPNALDLGARLALARKRVIPTEP